jgi:regulator of sirC expression with transglutaminase-like and TPR domain
VSFSFSNSACSDDEQFMRLVRRETDVDLLTAALEISRDGQSDVNFPAARGILQRAVSRLTHPVTQAGSDLEELKLLSRYMTEELGLHGESEYLADPHSHYVNQVLATGRGIPISLSLIYLHVGNELGIPLEPISTPARFLIRLPTDQGHLYVDAFDRGRILDEGECIDLIGDLASCSALEVRRHLRPVDERAVVIRMLQNLKALFGGREDWSSAWKVQTRLQLLLPGSWRERRDHAVLTMRAGHYGEAIDLLERSLAVCPAEDRLFLQNHLRQARRMLPECN